MTVEHWQEVQKQHKKVTLIPRGYEKCSLRDAEFLTWGIRGYWAARDQAKHIQRADKPLCIRKKKIAQAEPIRTYIQCRRTSKGTVKIPTGYVKGDLLDLLKRPGLCLVTWGPRSFWWPPEQINIHDFKNLVAGSETTIVAVFEGERTNAKER